MWNCLILFLFLLMRKKVVLGWPPLLCLLCVSKKVANIFCPCFVAKRREDSFGYPFIYPLFVAKRVDLVGPPFMWCKIWHTTFFTLWSIWIDLFRRPLSFLLFVSKRAALVGWPFLCHACVVKKGNQRLLPFSFCKKWQLKFFNLFFVTLWLSHFFGLFKKKRFVFGKAILWNTREKWGGCHTTNPIFDPANQRGVAFELHACCMSASAPAPQRWVGITAQWCCCCGANVPLWSWWDERICECFLILLFLSFIQDKSDLH